MKTAIVLGTFDGLHAGHRAVIEQAKGFYSTAVTFDIPPKSAVSKKTELLILPDDRIQRIKALGINEVVMQDFEKVKTTSAKDYLLHLKQNYNPDRIVCGFNYRFGFGAEGDTQTLADFCSKNNIEFICVAPVQKDGVTLSATNIRNLIRQGDVLTASSQIYGGFSFCAPVLHGDARGRMLGFPTANQQYPKDLVQPKHGVYISRVTIDKTQYKSITNIGIRPTYQTDAVGCETFIKDFSGDIYGESIRLELLQFVRAEQKFSSAEELKKAILKDIDLL